MTMTIIDNDTDKHTHSQKVWACDGHHHHVRYGYGNANSQVDGNHFGDDNHNDNAIKNTTIDI